MSSGRGLDLVSVGIVGFETSDRLGQGVLSDVLASRSKSNIILLRGGPNSFWRNYKPSILTRCGRCKCKGAAWSREQCTAR